MKYEMEEREFEALKAELYSSCCLLDKETFRLLKNWVEKNEEKPQPPTPELGPDYLGDKIEKFKKVGYTWNHLDMGLVRADIKSYLQGKIKKQDNLVGYYYGTTNKERLEVAIEKKNAYKEDLEALCGSDDKEV